MLLTVALLLICGASAVASEENSEKMKVIFDTDNGVFGDDTKALFMMLNSGKIDLLGITTVIGNNWVEASTAYTLRHLELAGRTDIPVYMGMGEPLMGDHTPYLENGMLTGIVGGNIGYMGGAASGFLSESSGGACDWLSDNRASGGTCSRFYCRTGKAVSRRSDDHLCWSWNKSCDGSKTLSGNRSSCKTGCLYGWCD